MKSYTIFALALLGILLCWPVSKSQAQNKKVIAAVHQLMDIPFFSSFDSIGNVMEGAARRVKNDPLLYSETEMNQLQNAYETSAMRFNKVLTSMKMDLLNPKKLKLILNDPKTYSESYQFKLEQADNAYQQEFVQLKAKIDNDKQIDGFSIPLLITILEGTYQVFKYLQEVKREVRKFTEELLDTYLVAPHRVLLWEEL